MEVINQSWNRSSKSDRSNVHQYANEMLLIHYLIYTCEVGRSPRLPLRTPRCYLTQPGKLSGHMHPPIASTVQSHTILPYSDQYSDHSIHFPLIYSIAIYLCLPGPTDLPLIPTTLLETNWPARRHRNHAHVSRETTSIIPLNTL
jgi:hypothetical protein